MKKYLLLLLIICTLLSIVSLSSCARSNKDEEEEYIPPVYQPSEGLEFTLSNDGTCYTWTGRGTCEDTRIVVPAEYNGKPVKAVSYVFFGIDKDGKLEELILPEGIETISDKSFYGCFNLCSVTIPKSLKKIGTDAFLSCSIQTIYINNLRSWLNIEGYMINNGWDIDYYVEGKLLTDLKIPEGIKTIRSGAFYRAKSIKTVTIPNGVESIGQFSFSECENLISVHLPNTLKEIGRAAFQVCTSLETLNIPDSVTHIGVGAFWDNFSLRRVTLGKNLENIEGSAFGNCFALAEVCNKSSLSIEKGSSDNGAVALYAKKITTNPNDTNIKNIGDYVFYLDGNNSSLIYYRGDDKNLVLPNIGYQYEINAFAFAESEIESVVIPDFVTAMGDRAFYQCLNLKSVEIQANIPAIEKYTFYKCESLESVNLPSSLTRIGDSAFYYCSMLQNVEMPNGVTTIGEYAFGSCLSLTNIIIPASVTSLGKGAFNNCENMRSVTILGSITTIAEYTFGNCRSLITVTLPNSLTRIETYAFAYCSSLFTITIPSNVSRIDETAFYHCYSLIEICNKSNRTVSGVNANVIKKESESNLKYVGDYVFYDDGNEVYLVKYLGNDGEAVLPEYENGKEYKIHKYAFAYSDISSAIISDSVTSIGEYAFGECSNLTSIVIPKSVTSINTSAFLYCYNLTDIYYTGTQEEWNVIVINAYLHNATIHCNYIP